MKYLIVMVALGGCTSSGGGGDDGGGGDLLAAPDACASGMLAYATDVDGATSASGSLAVPGNFLFANKISNDPGELLLGGNTGSGDAPWVEVFFDSLVVDGGTVPARGAVAMPDIGVVGTDCDTEQLSGTISVGKGEPKIYKFQLARLRAGTTCDAPLIAGGFSGCYSD